MSDRLFYVSAEAGKTPPFLRFAGERLRNFLVPKPQDVVTAEVSYVFVLPVSDTRVFFDEAAMDETSERFFLSHVPMSVRDDVAVGRSILIIDISNEGIYYSKKLFDSICRWLSSHRMEERRILILNQNRSLGKLFARDFPESRLVFLDYDYFIRSVSCLFDPVRFEPFLIQTLRNQDLTLEQYRRPLSPKTSSAFLCLNATPRPHRMLFVALLKEAGLLSSTLYTFHGLSNQKGAQFGPETAVRLAQKLGFTSVTEAVESFYGWVSSFEDRFSERGNDLAMRIDTDVYDRSFASLVTETEISDGDMTRVTEKTLKPLFMEHPLLVFGNVGSLRIVRDLGFQTFSPYIDESYDELPSAAQRTAALLRSISRLRDSIESADSAVLGPLQEIARHNSRFARECFSSEYEIKYEFPIVRFLREISLQ
ncbi:hypothetical protein XH98_37290 [Bradyrhizobium sp. CCBAU 51745]|uniref:hypothetical protein n=1 Tax=Bradyrhizobium sp. CCBAU 51745 TaxID=1325099 RepID=UPI002306DB26|nr:hypothetical protein [Bradyrhizobium sp. CCBAU 51745]MDA9444625.1 hypothetical protein [Bradyrhizobium sp. CCBAU 51745]